MKIDVTPQKKIVRVSADNLLNLRFMRPLRDSQSLTQQEVADISDMTQKTVSNAETQHSDPRWKTVLRLLWSLGGDVLLELPEESCFYVALVEDEEL